MGQVHAKKNEQIGEKKKQIRDNFYKYVGLGQMNDVINDRYKKGL